MTRVVKPPRELGSFQDRKWREALSKSTEDLADIATVPFVTIAPSTLTSNERILTGSSNVSIADGGAGNSAVLDLTNSGVVAGSYLTASLTVDSKGRVTSATSGPSIGTLTQGGILFAGASGEVLQDVANLFYDDTNNRAGFGTNSPSSRVSLASGTTAVEGISQGDCQLYRSASNTWTTPDTLSALQLKGNTVEMLVGDTDYKKAGGTFSYSKTTANNSSTTETDLYSVTVNKHLFSDGESLSYWMAGTFANTVNSKQLRLKLGATTIFDSGALAIVVAADWYLEGKILRDSSTTQKNVGRLHVNDGTFVLDYATSSEDLTTSLILKLTGQGGASNDIAFEMAKILWEAS